MPQEGVEAIAHESAIVTSEESSCLEEFPQSNVRRLVVVAVELLQEIQKDTEKRNGAHC